MSLSPEEMYKRFTYHPPKGDQVDRYKQIRDMGYEFAKVICNNSQPSREQSLALTKIDEAVMWANAGIARNE